MDQQIAIAREQSKTYSKLMSIIKDNNLYSIIVGVIHDELTIEGNQEHIDLLSDLMGEFTQ